MTTKLLFAMLSTVFLFALAMVNTPAQALAAPVSVDPAPPEIGSCRYFCGNDPTAFKTRADCQAVCSTVCEAVC